MTNGVISFDQPSGGTVTSDQPAFTVIQNNPLSIALQCVLMNPEVQVAKALLASSTNATLLWKGVYGEVLNATGYGVHGTNGSSGMTFALGAGVYGESAETTGVRGVSAVANGVWAESQNSNALVAISHTSDSTLAALYAKAAGTGGAAAAFIGNVTVEGDIFLSNGDCAEEFEIASPDVEPGTVMVLDEYGDLEQSYQAYDKKVAGVISGAGDYKPGIILDRKEKVNSSNRLPIALVGKTYCKVDASYGGIETGDLLTTSPTIGHAMKATDPLKAFGAVIGKALSSLKTGTGLIPILIALQ